MKINSITTNTGNLKGRMFASPSGRERKSVHYRNNNNNVNYNEQINTTIRENSDGRVSFKGGAKTPLLHTVANFVADSPLVSEAIFAILITCGLRPLTIMASANKKEGKDKEKCAYQAVKSISSGVVGLGMTALVGTPIAKAAKNANTNGAFNIPADVKQKSQEFVNKGVQSMKALAEKTTDSNFVGQITDLIKDDVINLSVFKKQGKGAEKKFLNGIKENAPEYFDDIAKAFKEQRTLNNYAKTGKNVIDKLFQPVFMPVRAAITIALVPIILNMLGQKKPSGNCSQKVASPYDSLRYGVFQSNKEKELFHSFSGVVKYENK